MCKFKFYQNPSCLRLSVATATLVAILTGVHISMMIIENFFVWGMLIVNLLFLLLTIGGWIFFSSKVYIYDEKVVVKGLFGVITECKIANVEKVYKKMFLREGEFIILKDNREIATPNSYFKRNGYVRFAYTPKSANALKTFWKGPIEDVGDSEVF